MVNADTVDWDALRAVAIGMMRKAYAPYSEFPVGAAALVDDGRIVKGANVENMSYGLTLCAECGLVSELIGTGGGKLVAFTCVRGDELITLPCGRCRQLLWEHGGGDLLVETLEGVLPLRDLLSMTEPVERPKDRLTNRVP